MADIIPFRGTLYNPEKIKDLSKVVAPPYDVISPDEQDALYDSEPHSIIRVLLGKDLPGDNKKENKYGRAAGFLRSWQERGILKRDQTPCIYVYEQEFRIEDRKRRRIGFISLLKLEDFDVKRSSVHPHENTLSAPKEDRTRLISSIEANIGPIFAIFADENKSLDAILAQEMKSQPIIDILDRDRIRNRLWRVSEKAMVDEFVRLMKDKKLFIADGHHRYEVGLAYSKTQKDPKFGYILTYFTDIYADGIVILPVHRLLRGVSSDMLSGLEKDFNVAELSSKADARSFLSNAGPYEKRFVLYADHRFKGLALKDSNLLDVTVLHDMVIGPLEKRLEAGNARLSIDFTKDLDYAVKEVDKGRFSASIMLNPTKVTEVRDMAFSGRRMPQKSTYFYPKVLTGLVINVF